MDQKLHLVHRENSRLSIVKQCDLLESHRSGIYFKPKCESLLNPRLMRLIDEKLLDCPFYGLPRMTTWLKENIGYDVNHKHIDRLYKVIDLQTISPKNNLSKRNQKHKIFPYLLKNLMNVRPNQVWQADISYIPLKHGFMYMVAIWMNIAENTQQEYSNTINTEWCLEVYEDTIE